MNLNHNQAVLFGYAQADLIRMIGTLIGLFVGRRSPSINMGLWSFVEFKALVANHQVASEFTRFFQCLGRSHPGDQYAADLRPGIADDNAAIGNHAGGNAQPVGHPLDNLACFHQRQINVHHKVGRLFRYGSGLGSSQLTSSLRRAKANQKLP